MNPFKIFLVEDDPWYGELLKYHLSHNPEFIVILFSDAKSCLDKMHERPDVVCIDYGLPDMNGDKLLKRLLALDNSLPVIVISGQEDVSVAVQLLKLGARDYIVKDDNSKELLWSSIIQIRQFANLQEEVKELKQELNHKYDFEDSIIGQSQAIKKVYHLIEKAINTNINVSISGDTGTGKELVAKTIHYNSPRQKEAFIAVNMGAIPNELLESELFGHEKGAFTGAIGRKIGRFEAANDGTLFLDEIGEMPLEMQTKILRALQERETTRIGGHDIIKLNFRLITATNKTLIDEVETGTFREDLYYRIMGLPIHLPPLRERDQDTLLLAKFFMQQFVKDNGMGDLIFEESAKDKIMGYAFPGNIRELKAMIDLACVMCNGKEIHSEDLTFSGKSGSQVFTSKERTLKEYNQEIISHFLKKYDKNVVLVAKKLGIGKSTIYNFIQSGLIDLDNL